MMEIIGYGEDSLSLWAIKNRMPELLGQLHDGGAIKDVKVIYRPSLGRGSHGFGEFDMLIKGAKAIYAIECKWERTRAVNKKAEKLVLSDAQIKRHEAFKALYEAWVKDRPPCDRVEFLEKIRRQGTLQKIPKFPDSKLVENLWSIFKYICGDDASPLGIKNVLLYFYCSGQEPKFKPPDDFESVFMQYTQRLQMFTVDNYNGFVDLNALLTSKQ